MRRPALLTARYWSAKRQAILIGFVLTVAGSAGTQFYVAPVQQESAAQDQAARQVTADIDTLKNAQAQVLVFQQQGALVYALHAAGLAGAGEAQRQEANTLYQLALLDRSAAMLAVVAQLAVAHLADQGQVATDYRALVDRARADFSLPAYTAVDDFETGLMTRAGGLMVDLQARLLAASQAKDAADLVADQRQVVLVVLMALGSAFLLVANLLSTRAEKAAEAEHAAVEAVTEPGEGGSPDRVAELTIAAHLIQVALDRARALNSGRG